MLPRQAKACLFSLTFFVGCASTAQEVPVVLSVPSAVEDQVDSFVFVVESEDSGDAILFPETCLAGGQSCLQSEGCGFSAADPEFRPEIPFNDSVLGRFPKGDTLTIRACAMDSSLGVVASASGSILNQGGESPLTLNLDTADASCNFLAPCE